MIEFYKFVPQFGLRDASPFCLKLYTYLCLAGVPHNVNEILDTRKAPKQKLPFIIHEGKTIGDSELIIVYLKEKFGDTLGEGLTETQRAIGHAFNVMLAERFYWAGLLCPRWLDPKHHPALREAWFASVPKPLRGLVSGMVFREVAKATRAHGIGRHKTEEISRLALSDIDAIEAFLGTKSFFLDEQPREIDATVYAFLLNATCEVFPSPINDRVRASQTLMTYIERVDQAAFGAVTNA